MHTHMGMHMHIPCEYTLDKHMTQKYTYTHTYTNTLELTRESNKLRGNDVPVAILDLLVVLVLPQIEVVKVKEFERPCALEAAIAVEDRQVEC